MAMQFNYKNARGKYAGHATGHGYTIVFESRPLGDYREGAKVEQILSTCAMQLEYMIDADVATKTEHEAYIHLMAAIDLLVDDEDG